HEYQRQQSCLFLQSLAFFALQNSRSSFSVALHQCWKDGVYSLQYSYPALAGRHLCLYFSLSLERLCRKDFLPFLGRKTPWNQSTRTLACCVTGEASHERAHKWRADLSGISILVPC